MNEKDYSSIDKLVDFGNGLSIAKQMTNTMNTAIENMNIPGSKIYKNKNGSDSCWFIEVSGKPAGPFSEEEIKTLIKEKKLNENSLVWKQGMETWNKIKDTPEIWKLFVLASSVIIE